MENQKEIVKIECELSQHGRVTNKFKMEGTWEQVKLAYADFLKTHEAFLQVYKEVEIKTEELRFK